MFTIFFIYTIILSKILLINLSGLDANFHKLPIEYVINFLFILFLSLLTRKIFIVFWIFFSIFYHISSIGGTVFSYELIIPLLQTDTKESFSYLSSIPSSQYLWIIFSILLGLGYIFFIKKYISSYFSKKIKISIFGFYIILIMIFGYSLSKKNLVIVKLIKAPYEIYKGYIYLNPPMKETSIKIIKQHLTQYNTYVVLIGESMRADFMSLYGFKYKTTPFLDSIPKKYISNFVATAVNTDQAVPRYLMPHTYSKGDEDIKLQPENNAVILANMAGYKTYWITSQGLGLDEKGTISQGRIGNKAQHISIPKHLWTDFPLLPYFNKAVHSPEKKVIFVHITGSHANACDKLFDYKNLYDNKKTGDEAFCYMSTYNKTDDLIKSMYTDLQKTKQNFMFIYLSDHGTGISKSNNKKHYLERPDNDIFGYNVPFIVMASDYKKAEKYNISRSGYHFFDFFAKTIGVETNVSDSKFDMFLSPSDKDIFVKGYASKLIPYSNLKKGLSAKEIVESITK